MDIWFLFLAVMAIGAGAGAAWLVAVAKLRAAATEATLLREHVARIEDDLKAARHEANLWRTQAETDANARARAETAASRVGGLEAECEALRRQLMASNADLATYTAKLEEQERGHREKIDALSAIHGEIERKLKNISSESLRDSQASFLQVANQVLERHKEGAAADLDARKLAVEALISPIRDALGACQASVAQLKEAGTETYGALSNELRNVVDAQNAVRGETSRLVNALRAAPKTRGRWGENTLRNVLDLAGLSPYCDFVAEHSYSREGVLSRPDVVIRLPGGRSIIVDAKAPMAAYLDAVDAVDDAERERQLKLHAQQLRSQVRLLSGKSYWDGLTETPDYVVMFVPGENFYAAAAERDPELFEFAAAQRVLIVTPATLIALAKAVAYGWRQEKVAQNAKRVHELGRDLYKRLSVMGGHIVSLGNNLAGSVRKYNDFIGSLESTVMPQARRFNELEVEGTGSELPSPLPIESAPRGLRIERDILVSALSEAAPEAAC